MATEIEKTVQDSRDLVHFLVDAMIDGKISQDEAIRLIAVLVDMLVKLPEPLESMSDLVIAQAIPKLVNAVDFGMEKLFRRDPERIRENIEHAKAKGRKGVVRRLRRVLARVESRQAPQVE